GGWSGVRRAPPRAGAGPATPGSGPCPGPHGTVVAGRPATVLPPGLGGGCLPVLPQEVGVEPGRDVGPGQHLVLGAVAVHVPVDREPLGGHGVLPQVERELLAPLLERAARPPYALDHCADPPVAAAGDPFGQR